MLIIVGLGNPGQKYANNRHNVGFMAADAIVRRHASFGAWQKKFSAEISEGRIDGDKVIVVKPQTFMNNSGQSVGEVLRFYKLTTDDLIVLYDEIDLAPGKIRIKKGGGAGGHNGIKSIDAHCGKEYARVRIGVGHPGHKDRVSGHVLGDFSKADQSWLEPLLEAIGNNSALLATGNHAEFMNKLALATSGSTPKPRENAKKGGTNETASDKAKGKSHIHQARSSKPAVEPKGPMAEMLKKLLGK